MSQLCTAQFIIDSGFATGLTPTVTINEALTGNLVGVFNMTETSDGNYIYDFSNSNDNLVYFFKYDSGTDLTINRYMGNNNKIETAVNVRGGGGSITYNNQISQEKVKEIAEKVVEMLPEQKEIVLDTSKIEEKLGSIETKIDEKDIEFDYDTILDGQDINTRKIIKKIDGIKIPKQDDKKVIEAINNIKQVDIVPIDNKLEKINENIENIVMTRIEKDDKKMEKLKTIQDQLKTIESGISEVTEDMEVKDELKGKDIEEKIIEGLQEDEAFRLLETDNVHSE